MALKELINNQTIIIDDHKRGAREVKDWDDEGVDVHIDKITNYRLNGKRQKVRIKVPINSDRPIKVENARKKELNEIPGQLKREIQRAFQDKTKRDSFIKDIVEHIKNFSTILENEERVKQVVSNISKHFELKWTEDKITTYTNDVLMLYSQLYTDDAGNEFFISVDKEKIRIGENGGYARHQKYLRIN